MEKKGRLNYIDSAKGLGVILVVLGHLMYDSNLSFINQGIYSFHMPLFFILSGFVFYLKEKSFGSFILKKVKRLLLPSLIFIAITIPVYIYVADDLSFIKAIGDLSFFKGEIPYNSPCWFLIVLFEVYVIAYLLNRLGKDGIIKDILALVIFFLLGYIVYANMIFIPFGMDKCLIALGFFYVGKILKRIYDKGIKRSIEIICLLVSIVLWYIFAFQFNLKVSMYEMKLGSYGYFVLSGIFGSIMIMLISKFFLDRKNWLTKIADHSVFIIGTHVAFVFAFRYIMKYLGLNGTYIYTLLAIVFAFILIAIYIPTSKWLDKKIPVLTGKMK